MSLQHLFDEARIIVEDNKDAPKVMHVSEKLLAGTAKATLEELVSSSGSEINKHNNGSATLSKSIALFIRSVASIHLDVRHLLLMHLSSISDPLPFVEILPALFSVSTTPSLIEDVVSQLIVLLEIDNSLLLPVIGAMVELPLTNRIVPQLAELAESAISLVQESDLPLLLRTLLKSLDLVSADRTVHAIRREVKNLSEDTIALVVDAMWEVFPSSANASVAFLDQISHDQDNNTLGLNLEPSLTDLSVVLILNSETGILKSKANSLLELWFKLGVFPFKHLELILTLSKTNEVWDRMVTAIWKICIWLLNALSLYSNIRLGPKMTNYNNTKFALCKLTLKLYQIVPSMQETILSSLLSQCYANNILKNIVESKSNTNAMIAPLGYAGYNEGIIKQCTGNSYSAQDEYLLKNKERKQKISHNYLQISPEQVHAALSSSLLETIVQFQSDAGSAMLSALTNRLHPSADGIALLPAPMIIHSMISSIAFATQLSTQTESTLLIVIQKLLAVVSQPNMELMSIFGAVYRKSCFSTSSGINDASMQIPENVNSGNSFAYTPRCIGLILAGHFVQRRDLNEDNHDIRAVFSWIERAFSTFQDVALVYALDFFATSCRGIHSEARGHQNKRRKFLTSYHKSSESVSSIHSHIEQIVSNCFEMFVRSHQLTFTLKDNAIESIPEYFRHVHDYDQQYSSRHKLDTKIVSLNSKEFSHEGKLAFIWGVATISKKIVDYLDDLEYSSSGGELGTKCVSLANSVFWSIQKLATISSYLSTKGNLSKLLQNMGVQLSKHSIYIDQEGKQLNEQETSKNKKQTSPIKSSPDLPVDHLFDWPPCPISDAFVAEFSLPTGIHSNIALRLAWERAIVAAILLGQMEKNTKDTSSTLDGVIQLLTQVNIGKYMLRIMQAISIAPNSEFSTSENYDVQRFSKAHAFHRDSIHRLLDRVTNLIRTCDLLFSMEAVLEIGSKNLEGKDIVKECFHIPSSMLRNGGLALLSVFVTRVLSRRSVEYNSSHGAPNCSSSSAPTFDIMMEKKLYSDIGNMNDIFVTLQESGTEASSDEYENTQQRLKKICLRLFALIPALIRNLEFQRKGEYDNAEKKEKSFISILGPDMDTSGSVIMILSIFLLLENKILSLQASCGGIIDEFAQDPTWKELSSIYQIFMTKMIEEDDGSVNNMKNKEDASELVNKLDEETEIDEESEKMVLFYNGFESQLRIIQDSTLAVAGLRLLTTFTRGTLLTRRCASLAWELMKSIYTMHTNISTNLARNIRNNRHPDFEKTEIPIIAGMDHLWPHLVEYVIRDQFQHDSIPELSSLHGKKSRNCANLFKNAFSPTTCWLNKKSHSIGDSSKLAAAAFRSFVATWWVHEIPQRRLYGIANIIMEAFKLSSIECADKHLVYDQELGKNIFAGLTSSNSDQYIALGVSILPSLLLLAKPSMTAINEKLNAGPYEPIINTIKLFVWFMKEIMIEPLDTLTSQMCNLIIKVCRAQIEATEVAINSALNWRDSYKNNNDNREDPKSNDSINEIDRLDNDDDASTQSSKIMDYGAVAYLTHFFSWAYTQSQWIIRFTYALKKTKVVRSVPQLQLFSERIASKVQRFAKTYLLELIEADTFESDDWQFNLLEGVKDFQQMHENTMRKSANTASSWQEYSAKTSIDLMMENNSDENNEISEDNDIEMDKEIDINNFTAMRNSSTSGGWGLYDEDEDM